jgi:hypothetical protein
MAALFRTGLTTPGLKFAETGQSAPERRVRLIDAEGEAVADTG